ncbi:AraC family transcriptional regulator [Roseateles cellulosilyticus]|uniref:AraC family transcriptional regulator n=1 Tax=Pelomonas cellulosilytica TaxID=2906762 RepID=A0ABS8XRH9_9BURK|nr:AraC family transcriptional regulator [Pelomonas sp. P8]MCE4553900.1 AraC family transcriptional regulator [Pelomonas sp. P8]
MSLHEKLYAPLKILAIVQVLAEHGITPEAALEGTHLNAEQIRDPDVRTSLQQLLTVGRNAVRLVPVTELGLHAGRRMHFTSYGLLGYALLSAVTLRQAFLLRIRYDPLATPVMSVSFFERDGMAIWRFPTHAELAGLGLNAAEYRFFLDLQFAIHVALTKDGMGPWCVPTRALYSLPAPPHAAQVVQTLECPVSFDRQHNELHYPREWLDRAPYRANPITAAQMSETCERLLTSIGWQAGLTRRVYDEITRTPGQFPSAESVASALCMTSRTLGRKLSAEGTSYSALVASVRHALASDYLRSTALSVEDIAAALGFSDARSFRHAFKRWSGKTPAEYRA